MDSINFGTNLSGALQVGINNGVIQYASEHSDLIFRDYIPLVEEALYNATTNEHKGFCLEQTRVELLSQVIDWAESPASKCIFWLNGKAGTGKSTIARTVAQSLEKKGLPVATFFFNRDRDSCRKAKHLISSVTRQLVTSNRQLEPSILKAIRKDPAIASRNLSLQFDKLVLEPLKTLDMDHPQTLVIVIDALDECDRQEDIQTIIHLISKLQDINSANLRVFLTSRPERSIRHSFRDKTNHQFLILDNLSESTIEHDLRLFLRSKFIEIRSEHSLSSNWPGDETIDKLTKMSIPLFIFAATACRFIKKGPHPRKSLQKFLESQKSKANQMDKVYLPVLNQFIEEDEDETREILEEFQNIIGTIILLTTPLSLSSLAMLLQIQADETRELLDSLHSVLSIPTDILTPIHILHSSFRDYLLETRSCFHIDEQETHNKIAACCMRIMETQLKRNICNFPKYGIQHKDLTPQAINHHITAVLQYACDYWVYHILESSQLHFLEVLAFFRKHFLHWLEVFSLRKITSEAAKIIKLLQSEALERGLSRDLVIFLGDAERFILRNVNIADNAPLQIYCSGLIFAPVTSIIRQTFRHEIYDQIQILSQCNKAWDSTRQTLEGFQHHVNAVTISHDSKLIAAASDNNTIRIWDFSTGNLIRQLESHTNSVYSVAFSNDCRFLASSSEDDTIKIWDLIDESNIITRKEHTNAVYDITFSPNSRWLASASADRSVKIWDTSVWTCEKTLEKHTAAITSVAFSCDSSLLAFASGDCLIKILDTENWKFLRILDDHKERVNSIAFSYDFAWLASASADHSIKIWRTSDWACFQTLRDHKSEVNSVSFSNDSTRLASASADQTVKIWSTSTWQCSETLIGHGSWVTSVVFSPDSIHLASASLDHTVRVWDTTHRSNQQIWESHKSRIESVAFPDKAKLLASAGDDCTIKIWDASNGTYLRTLKDHKSFVFSVDFSHDFSLLASASADRTVKIWHTNNGECLCTLKNHIDSVVSVSFSHNSKILASASLDKTISIWNVTDGELLEHLTAHKDKVYCVAFSPNSEYLASTSRDGSVIIWKTSNWTCLHNLNSCNPPVCSVIFSKNSMFFASASENGIVIVWDVIKGERRQILDMGEEVWVRDLDTQQSHLRTTQGIVDLSLCPEGGHPVLHSEKPQLHGCGMSPDREWITWNSNKILWLPPEYRSDAGRCNACAISESRIFLGSNSGRVLMLELKMENRDLP